MFHDPAATGPAARARVASPDVQAVSGGAGARRRPLALLVLVLVVVVEAAALLGVLVTYVARLLAAGAAAAGSATGAVATGVLAAAVAAFLLASARALLLGRRWGRAPVLVWQLLQALVLARFLGGPWWWAGALGLGLAAVALVCLFAPRVVAATAGEQAPPVT